MFFYVFFRGMVYLIYFTAAFCIAAIFYTVYFTSIGLIWFITQVVKFVIQKRREKFERENESIANDLPSWRFR